MTTQESQPAARPAPDLSLSPIIVPTPRQTEGGRNTDMIRYLNMVKATSQTVITLT